MSIAVTAEMTARSESVVLQEPLVVLGDVLPGDFSLGFDVLVLAPLQSFSADLQVEWGQIGVPERETDIFGFTVLAQAANIDWGALEYWHPYGTVPAEGSNFIGRGEVVRNLASRLLHSPMEPFYITGQKRVGKTSLALAAVKFASEHAVGRVLREAVRSRDADVTATEVQNALEAEVSALDANSFAHLWHDGILKPIAEREPDVVRRRRVLVCLARCARKRLPLKLENLLDKKNNSSLSNGEIVATLNEFVWRRVLTEADGEYKFFLPIFERWLTQDGLAIVQPDAVSEELAASVQADEDAAFVRSDEIVALVKPWSTYQGRHIGTDDVRAWYEQVDGHREQRLLFKLLSGIKFVSDAEIREKASSAFVQLSKQLDEFVRHSLADRRTDVLLTYLDGHGKSGEYITSLFAEVNKISVSQICSQVDVGARLIAAVEKGNPISAVIIVDDIAGTGRTLASSVGKFVAGTQVALRIGNTKILTCALYATRAATEHALASCRAIEHVECDFRAGEVLSQKSFAFSDESPLWANQDERERARALATDLGSRIYRSQPLGFGGMGLLIVFPTTVPNNTLPILHSSSKSGLKPWRPLFPRPTN